MVLSIYALASITLECVFLMPAVSSSHIFFSRPPFFVSSHIDDHYNAHSSSRQQCKFYQRKLTQTQREQANLLDWFSRKKRRQEKMYEYTPVVRFLMSPQVIRITRACILAFCLYFSSSRHPFSLTHTNTHTLKVIFSAAETYFFLFHTSHTFNYHLSTDDVSFNFIRGFNWLKEYLIFIASVHNFLSSSRVSLVDRLHVMFAVVYRASSCTFLLISHN